MACEVLIILPTKPTTTESCRILTPRPFLVAAQLAAPFLGTIHPFKHFVFVGPAAGESYFRFSVCTRSQGACLSILNLLALSGLAIRKQVHLRHYPRYRTLDSTH